MNRTTNRFRIGISIICICLSGLLVMGLVTRRAYASDASASVTVSLSTERTSYASGEYVSFKAKYNLDYGKVAVGDTLTITVPDCLKSVSVSYSPLHFSGCNDLGGGTYQLAFNENAPTGLTGYLSVSGFADNTSSSVTSGTVTVGNASVSLTVSPLPDGDPGTETRAIEKWAPTEGSTKYNQTDAVTGIYTYNQDATVHYAIEVDPRKTAMANVVVTDVIPDELTLAAGSVRIAGAEGTNMTAAEVASILTIKGQTLTFSFGDIPAGTAYRIDYLVNVPAGTNGSIANTAVINYGAGSASTEVSSFTIKSSDAAAGAAVGYKKVDKTEISDDQADQIVTYTIRFQNDGAFAAGDINLKDALNPLVKYVTSYGSKCFALSYDAAANTVSIVNTKEIAANSVQEVTIVTDFSQVPVGTTVTNTVGGNTVKTVKKPASLVVSKTVRGQGADKAKAFNFTVTLGDKTINGAYGGMSFVNGVAEFALKDGESRSAAKLPAGTTYLVTEEDYSGSGYTTAATGERGTIAAGQTAKAGFTNTFGSALMPQPKPVVNTANNAGYLGWLALVVIAGTALALIWRQPSGRR